MKPRWTKPVSPVFVVLVIPEGTGLIQFIQGNPIFIFHLHKPPQIILGSIESTFWIHFSFLLEIQTFALSGLWGHSLPLVAQYVDSDCADSIVGFSGPGSAASSDPWGFLMAFTFLGFESFQPPWHFVLWSESHAVDTEDGSKQDDGRWQLSPPYPCCATWVMAWAPCTEGVFSLEDFPTP